MSDQYFAFVGTYTWDDSEGIYVFEVDGSTGEFTPISTAPAGENPSFLAVHPSGDYLYSVNEVDDGTVTAFRIDRGTGELHRLNRASTGDAGPCHCSIDATGTYVLVANYAGGSVSALPIREDGRIGDATQIVEHTGSSVHPERQTQAHAHSIVSGPENEFAYVPDLGTDRIVIYEFDPEDGPLRLIEDGPVRLHDGAGPRHFAFHPTASFAYVINELDSTLTAFRRDPDSGTLSEITTVSTLPAWFDGDNWTADLHVHPSGQWLFGSNRGHDSIAIFAIDRTTGRPTLVGHESTRGETPRNFALDPTGERLFVENQDTNDVYAYRFEDGTLDLLGHVADVPRPVCLRLITA